MLWFVFVYLLVFLYFSKLALKCYIDLVILFDVTSIICFVVNKFLALSLFRTDFYAPFECCGCVTLQESGGGGDKAEDVVHEQQGLPQEGAGRRRQGDPGVRLWRPGLDVCS